MRGWKELARTLPAPGDAALLTALPDQRLFTGFPADDAVVIVAADHAALFTDSRYIEAAGRAVKSMEVVCYTRLFDDVATWVKDKGITRLFVQTEDISLSLFSAWQEQLAQVEVCADRWLDDRLLDLRAVKTPEQIDKIRAAQALTDEAFQYVLTVIHPGRTEREIALDLEFFLRRSGADDVAFDSVVVAGENGSLPHGVPGNRPIQRGDLVTMDFGALLDGWHADMTRTVAVGTVADWQKEIYHTVLLAQETCLSTLKAGITGREGDAAARRVIEQAGYGAFFGHGTGHGVGLQIHEAPALSSRRGDYCLRPGEVVTVEPGIYLPQKGGVRIEDMVVITPDGCENLTKSPKNLIIL